MTGVPEVRRGQDDTGLSWSPRDVEVLTAAVRRAPSVHNTRPWSLEVHGRIALLREQPEAELAHHDPEGRDRRISCGAALANLVVAVRHLGWTAEVDIGVSDDVVTATVTGSRRKKPLPAETRRYRAVDQRRSHRHAFAAPVVTGQRCEAVLAAASTPEVEGRWINRGVEALAVARLLEYSARTFQRDADYQRELRTWTAPPGETNEPGVPADAFASAGVAAVGLVTASTRLPDEYLLASRIEHECVLVLSTSADTPKDHVRAGEAIEDAWLEATSLGLAASIITQPLHLEEVRTGLADRLGLSTVPQALLRFGQPAERTAANTSQ